jgi:hypothetical protein
VAADLNGAVAGVLNDDANRGAPGIGLKGPSGFIK